MTNPFEAGGQAYAAQRPTYPSALAHTLAGLVERRALAVDVGCGSGQLTVLLADHFDQTLGLDPSQSQLSGATAHPRARYQSAPAENLPVKDSAADLITAAQAAHWFDRPKFYAEVRRISAPGAVLALITYNNPRTDSEALAPIMALYEALDPWWRPERHDVEAGYANFEFPFDPIKVDGGVIERAWDFAAIRAYVETWSALRFAREAGQGGLVDDHLARARAAWGESVRVVVWPVTVRAGRV